MGALQQKASDIHIEPFEKKLVLRYRVDGILREAPFNLPYSFRNALIAKIKIMTNQMDITERRKPQDGRIQVTAKGNPIEFRVNILPTVFGESCCSQRASLDRSSIQVDMNKMGFLPDTLDKLKEVLAAAVRIGARLRSDRLGKIDHAVCRAQFHQYTGYENF